MDATQKEVDVPETEAKWINLPFFIKLPMGSLHTGGPINRPMRYVSVMKRNEAKQDTESHDADSRNESSMALDIKKGDEVKQMRESHTTDSKDEKLKYTTASCATPDMADKNRMMQFYFTPVGKVQDSTVVLGGPPPPPSRIEYDSAADNDEFQGQQEEDDMEQAFIELVGREYVFPLQVKAVIIPDMKSQ